MRGLKNEWSGENILDGLRIHYNFLKPHISLNGKTPAQVAGIDLDIENGWHNLIETATI